MLLSLSRSYMKVNKLVKRPVIVGLDDLRPDLSLDDLSLDNKD